MNGSLRSAVDWRRGWRAGRRFQPPVGDATTIRAIRFGRDVCANANHHMDVVRHHREYLHADARHVLAKRVEDTVHHRSHVIQHRLAANDRAEARLSLRSP